MNDLEEFMSLNSIRIDDLLEALHLDVRETILKIVCDKLKKDKTFFSWAKKVFFSTADDTTATKKVIDRACKCKLSESDTLWMKNCIKAFFTKSSLRETIPQDVKESLLCLQHNKCAICGKEITLQTLHVDHIIPWDYVGDKLDNNYQGLCKDCNLAKSNHVAITVTNLILHREERK